jgi:hypothetical protein
MPETQRLFGAVIMMIILLIGKTATLAMVARTAIACIW